MIGLLLEPRAPNGRQLPDGVRFAANAAALADFLTENGISASQAEAGAALDPLDLDQAASNMTVLVNCWN